MRSAWSIGVTKILPSPICPVRAPEVMTSTALSAMFGRDRDFDPQFGQEVHDIFGAAIDLGVALLAAVALDLGHRHAVDADGGERLAHLVQLEGFDDRDDEFHGLALFP